jgi:hypothetical protein
MSKSEEMMIFEMMCSGEYDNLTCAEFRNVINELMEQKNKVVIKKGDIVIDCSGNVGYVVDFCECDKCKERGFFEPEITPVSGKRVYISNYDNESGYANFYRIGNRKFPEHVNLERLYDTMISKKSL